MFFLGLHRFEQHVHRPAGFHCPFGEEAVIPTLLYFFANTTFFWTMGNYMESIDGAVHDQRQIPKVFH